MKKSSINLSYLAIYFIILIVGCIIYYIYAFQPTNSKISELNRQDMELKGKIAQYNQLVLNAGKTKAEIAQLRTDLASKKKFLPMSGLKIAADINAGLKKAGIRPDNVTMGTEVISSAKSTSGAALCSVNASVKFKTSEKQITDLLHYYEKSSDAVYYVETVEYIADEKAKGVFTTTLSITAYYFGSQLLEEPNGFQYINKTK